MHPAGSKPAGEKMVTPRNLIDTDWHDYAFPVKLEGPRRQHLDYTTSPDSIQTEMRIPWIPSQPFCNIYIYIYKCIYIYIYIWLLIKNPWSRNGHSSRIKMLLSRNFRELHVYLSAAHVGQQHLLWRFVPYLPNYARESRITSWCLALAKSRFWKLGCYLDPGWQWVAVLYIMIIISNWRETLVAKNVTFADSKKTFARVSNITYTAFAIKNPYHDHPGPLDLAPPKK